MLIALILVRPAQSQSDSSPGVVTSETRSSALPQPPKKGNHKIDQLCAAVRREPRSAGAYNNLGTALAKARQFDGAIHAYEKAVELEPHFVAAEMNLESAVQRQVSKPAVLEKRRAAVKARSDSALAHALLGHAL